MDTEKNTKQSPLVLWPKDNEEAQRAFLAGMELCRLIAVQRAAMCCSGIARRDQAEGVELGAAQIAQRIHSSMALLSPHVGKVDGGEEGNGSEGREPNGPASVPSDEDLEKGCKIDLYGRFDAKFDHSTDPPTVVLLDGRRVFAVHEDLVKHYSYKVGDS